MKGLIALLAASILLIGCTYSREPECSGNCFNGFGIKRWKDGGYIKANWKNGEPDGKGIEYFGSTSEFTGDTYEGSFRGKFDGYGRYYGKSEDAVHVGYWKNGKPNGYGTSTFGAHSTNPSYHYEGGWKDGKKSGYGVLNMGAVGPRAGVIYAGHWLDDKMEGLGKYSWPDGSRYVGHFSNDFFDGEAVFIFSDGYTLKSVWNQGYSPDFEKVLAWHSKRINNKDSLLIKFFYRKERT